MYLLKAFEGRNDWWRYLLGLVIIFAFYFIGQVPLYFLIMYRFQTQSDFNYDTIREFESTMNFDLLGVSNNVGLGLLLSMFIFAMIGLYLVVTKLHSKRFLSLVVPSNVINWRKIGFGFVMWLILGMLMEFCFYLQHPENYTLAFNLSAFIPLLIICLLILPIQTSFEELVFRGYLMQGFYYFSKSKWLVLVVTTLLFALVHGTNPEVHKYGFLTMMSYYLVAGAFLALITIVDDSLELALGVHAATNFFSAVFLTYEGSVLNTDSMFKTHQIDPGTMTIGFGVIAIIFYLICAKKYKWSALSKVFRQE